MTVFVLKILNPLTQAKVNIVLYISVNIYSLKPISGHPKMSTFSLVYKQYTTLHGELASLPITRE